MAKKIAYQWELDLNGYKIPCYVLDDWTRVLSWRWMQESLKMVDEGEEGKRTSGTRLARYLDQNSLKPFIYSEKSADHFAPIECYLWKSKINWYEATTLVDICDAFLEARKHIKLSSRQEMIAEQSEILMRSFAKIWIIALVDEATGYQYDREKDELQKILKVYISEELLPRQKRFPDAFYKELFRLNGWDFTVNWIKSRPSVIGTRTNTLIYNQLPKWVIEELKKNTPKNKQWNYTQRFHQSLTEDVGTKHLQDQITEIITIFRLSDNMKDMWMRFEQLNQRKAWIYPLPFVFDEKWHTVEPVDKSKLSDFNQKLSKAIEYNPKEKKG